MSKFSSLVLRIARPAGAPQGSGALESTLGRRPGPGVSGAAMVVSSDGLSLVGGGGGGITGGVGAGVAMGTGVDRGDIGSGVVCLAGDWVDVKWAWFCRNSGDCSLGFSGKVDINRS